MASGTDNKIHPFHGDTGNIVLPEKFNSPFRYTPHPLCLRAAEEVRTYLRGRPDWQEELSHGKMFGVLAVRDSLGRTGFLAAFSGMLADSNTHPYFVPPVYDLQASGGFFKPEEEEISAINRRITALENDAGLHRLEAVLAKARSLGEERLSLARRQLAEAREGRKRLRAVLTDPGELAALDRESQFQKASFKRLGRHWSERISRLEQRLSSLREETERLKQERRQRSAALQARLFSRFLLLDALGHEKDICTLFREAGRGLPPAGTGECCAPRLLQHAYREGLRPLAMAEFWWGASPRSEIRRDGCFYPACREKCEPLLAHMLKGLDVEEAFPDRHGLKADVLYEDPWLAVLEKPAGLLSVPGRSDQDSVYAQCRKRYPDAEGPLIVHRLDMDTSGLILVARSMDTYRALQAQFTHRSVRKEYTALLEGIPSRPEGTINLPLCPNPDERPRQMVSRRYGKPAVTRYRVLAMEAGRALVLFQPETGRTHQLRMHAAHPEGLDCPIRGDRLYGQEAERLFLHASLLTFRHPADGRILTFTSPLPEAFPHAGRNSQHI